MSEINFEREVEKAQMELSNSPMADGLEPETQEQLRQIESLAQMNPEFANSEEYKDLVTALKGQSVQADEEEDEEEDDEDEEGEDDDSEEEEEVDDIFGILKTPKKAKEIKLNFEPQKEMVDFISSKYGVKDVSKFFSSVETWRGQAQEGAEIKKDFDALAADLQAMPSDIRLAVQLWADGKDHTTAFTQANQRLDFSVDFRNQDTENLVQHYLGEQYDELLSELEDGDITESEFNSRIKLLGGSTKRLFNEDKQALESEREDFVQRQKSEFQNMKKSALLSVENLGKAYPDFSKSEISKIRNILVDGKIDSLFANADGSYNDDAAELVAYAMYGKKMLESVKKVAQRKGESMANQKIVDTSPKSLRKQKSSGPSQGYDAKAVGHLSGVFKNDPYA